MIALNVIYRCLKTSFCNNLVHLKLKSKVSLKAYTNSWSGVMEWSGAVEWSGILELFFFSQCKSFKVRDD